jgi:hypothetical protein
MAAWLARARGCILLLALSLLSTVPATAQASAEASIKSLMDQVRLTGLITGDAKRIVETRRDSLTLQVAGVPPDFIIYHFSRRPECDLATLWSKAADRCPIQRTELPVSQPEPDEAPVID